MVLRDTRPDINHNLSYDREGRVITVIDGQGEGPNLYVVKLLHERGNVKVNEPWLIAQLVSVRISYG